MSNVLEYNSFYFCYSSKYLFAWEQNFNHYLTSLVEMWLNCLYPDNHDQSNFATKHNVNLSCFSVPLRKFRRRDIFASMTKILYWWWNICSESGQEYSSYIGLAIVYK